MSFTSMVITWASLGVISYAYPEQVLWVLTAGWLQ